MNGSISRRPSLRPETLAKIRQELKRMESSQSPRVLEYVSSMRAKYPELRG